MAEIRWYSSKEIRALYGLSNFSLGTLVKQGKIQREKNGHAYIYRDPELFAHISSRPTNPDYLPLLRGVEVARILKLRPDYVRHLAKTGRINSTMVGRNRRYSLDDVQKYIAYREARRKMPWGDPRPVPGEKKRREAMVSYLERQLLNQQA